LPCFQRGALRVCYTEGSEGRAGALAGILANLYEILASRTGARPGVGLAVLNRVHWQQSACPRSYPQPTAAWDGESGTVFVPQAYDRAFLRAWYVPETVAAWPAWPPGTGHLGEPAKALLLADLLAVQELASLFLRELRVAPSDPVLHRLLTSYLTQVALHAAQGVAADWQASVMGGLWNAWGETLARAGADEGRVRLQARALYQQHGDALVASFTGNTPSVREQIATSVAAGI
jgi:hypothetical protein